MSKPEPIPFNCPSCKAEHHIVTVDAPCDTQDYKAGCLKCGFPFPGLEGADFLRYFLVGRPRSPYIRHKRGRESDE